MPGILQGTRRGADARAGSRFSNLNAAAGHQQLRKLLQIISGHTRERSICKSCLMCLRIFYQLGHGVQDTQLARRYWLPGFMQRDDFSQNHRRSCQVVQNQISEELLFQTPGGIPKAAAEVFSTLLPC